MILDSYIYKEHFPVRALNFALEILHVSPADTVQAIDGGDRPACRDALRATGSQYRVNHQARRNLLFAYISGVPAAGWWAATVATHSP